jgi:hypothetical protein
MFKKITLICLALYLLSANGWGVAPNEDEIKKSLGEHINHVAKNENPQLIFSQVMNDKRVPISYKLVYQQAESLKIDGINNLNAQQCQAYANAYIYAWYGLKPRVEKTEEYARLYVYYSSIYRINGKILPPLNAHLYALAIAQHGSNEEEAAAFCQRYFEAREEGQKPEDEKQVASADTQAIKSSEEVLDAIIKEFKDLTPQQELRQAFYANQDNLLKEYTDVSLWAEKLQLKFKEHNKDFTLDDKPAINPDDYAIAYLYAENVIKKNPSKYEIKIYPLPLTTLTQNEFPKRYGLVYALLKTHGYSDKHHHALQVPAFVEKLFRDDWKLVICLFYLHKMILDKKAKNQNTDLQLAYFYQYFVMRLILTNNRLAMEAYGNAFIIPTRLDHDSAQKAFIKVLVDTMPIPNAWSQEQIDWAKNHYKDLWKGHRGSLDQMIYDNLIFDFEIQFNTQEPKSKIYRFLHVDRPTVDAWKENKKKMFQEYIESYWKLIKNVQENNNIDADLAEEFILVYIRELFNTDELPIEEKRIKKEHQEQAYRTTLHWYAQAKKKQDDESNKHNMKGAALTDAETRQYHRDDEDENGGGTGCPSGCVITGPGIEVLLKNDGAKTVELDAETIAFLKQVKALMDSANEWSDPVAFMARAIEEMGMLEAMPRGTPWIEIVEMAFPEAQNNFFRALNRAMEARRQAAAQEDAREEQLLNRMDRDAAFTQVGIDAQAIDGQTEPVKEEIMVGVTLNGHIFGKPTHTLSDAALFQIIAGIEQTNQNTNRWNAALEGPASICVN